MPQVLGMWVAEPRRPPHPRHISNLQPMLASKSVSKLPPGASPGLRSLLSYANCCSEQLEIVPTEVWGCSSLHASLWKLLSGARGWDGRGTQEGLLWED